MAKIIMQEQQVRDQQLKQTNKKCYVASSKPSIFKTNNKKVYTSLHYLTNQSMDHNSKDLCSNKLINSKINSKLLEVQVELKQHVDKPIHNVSKSLCNHCRVSINASKFTINVNIRSLTLTSNKIRTTTWKQT